MIIVETKIATYAYCQDCKWRYHRYANSPMAAKNHAQDNSHAVVVILSVDGLCNGRPGENGHDLQEGKHWKL